MPHSTPHQQAAGFQPRRILVRGVNWLGDAVMTTPALLRLREHFPGALIAMLTPEKLRGLWQHHPAVDEVITFKADEGPLTIAKKIQVMMWPDTASKRDMAEAAKHTAGAKSSSQRGGFDLALVLPNSPRSALEPWLAGVPHRVGYSRPWRNFFLTDVVPSRPDAVHMRKRSESEIKSLVTLPAQPDGLRFAFHDKVHQIYDYLNLAGALGANPEPLAPQLAVTPEEIKAVAQKFQLGQAMASRPIFGLNPGAEYGPAKRWPAQRFVAVAREAQKRTNCLWLIFGGKSDVPVAQEIAAAVGGPGSVINLAGQTSLRELCAVIKICRVLLTNDTGPMHIAGALGTPVVVPFGSTSPELTGPVLSMGAKHQLIKSDAPCSPCFLRECPIDFRCMNGITVERVVEGVLKSVS
jgi:heptosyltransferase-2